MKGMISISLEETQAEAFLDLKKRLGLSNDTEVIRFALNALYITPRRPAEAHS